MTPVSLNLLVLRAADLEKTLAFYRVLGLAFVQEQHGNGPIHYSCDLNGTVIEIFPGKPSTAPDRRNGGSTLIGFQVSNIAAIVETLTGENTPVLTTVQSSAWGQRAVVQDPDWPCR